MKNRRKRKKTSTLRGYLERTREASITSLFRRLLKFMQKVSLNRKIRSLYFLTGLRLIQCQSKKIGYYRRPFRMFYCHFCKPCTFRVLLALKDLEISELKKLYHFLLRKPNKRVGGGQVGHLEAIRVGR